MSVEIVKSLLRLYADAGLLRIRYSGGEPTLHPDLEKILAYGKELELYQVIFTNGQHITAEALKRWREMNVGEILISLHGSEATHDGLTRRPGSYRKAVNAILLAASTDISAVVEMTLVRQNQQEIFDTINVVKALGVKQFRLMRYVPRGKDDETFSVNLGELSTLIDWIEEEYDENEISIRFPCSQKFCLSEQCDPDVADSISDVRKKYLVQNCFAGLNWGSISHSGTLRFCPHSLKALANVFEEPQALIELWPSVIRSQALKAVKQGAGRCSGCKAWGHCLGGCYLSNLG